jgi:hypothetical protein
MNHNALKSLWGDGPKDSYREQKRKNTAKSMISPGDRPQDIRTPKDLLEAVAKCFGGTIVLDAADSLRATPAQHHYTGEEMCDGLKASWMDRTFCNPPYKDLKAWLDKAVNEATDDEYKSIIVLCPVRPHRSWFREAMRECSEIVYLNPIKFEGFDQAFPAPLCLMMFNVFSNGAFNKWGDSFL